MTIENIAHIICFDKMKMGFTNKISYLAKFKYNQIKEI